jgi:hypothetical protein
MPDNFPQLFTTQFATNLELKLQQMGTKLRATVREGMHVGKLASPINQVGAITAKTPPGVFAPKERTDPNFTRRWVFPLPKEIDQLIDTFEQLETIVDPKSAYVENAASAMGRAIDDIIIGAATGPAQIGTDNGSLSTETFATATFQILDTFGSTATSGLTVAKLIEARRIFRHYHNDLDTDALTAVIGSQQESDLLNQVEVVSTEYNDRPVLTDGKLTRFLGYDIKVIERLPSIVASGSGATCRGCLLYVKSGLYLGVWKDQTNRVSIRNDLSGEPYDLYTNMMFGATRTQPGKVLQVLATDTQGADITP